MKKKNYLLAALLLAAFTACDNESSMDMATEPPAEFTAHVGKQKVQTRMADATWDNGDCIGVFALDDDCATNYPGPAGIFNTYANGKYTYDGSKWNFDASGDVKKPYYFKNPNTTVVTFKAYYPWQANTKIAAGDPSTGIDNGTIVVDASQSQSSDAQKGYDFLFADKAPTSGAKDAPQDGTNTDGKPWGSKESTNVQFQFTHSMVKLLFILKPGTANKVTLDDVKKLTPFLQGIKSKGLFSLADGKVTATNDEATELELKNKTEEDASGDNAGSVQFVAIVVPQAKPTDATLRLEETSVPSAPESDSDKYVTKKLFSGLGNDGLQAGHQYTYTLTVKKMELVIESFGITEWQNENLDDVDDAVLQ